MDLTKAISHCRPGASCQVNGNDYAGIIWRDEAQSKPTLAELESAWEELSTQVPPEQRRVATAAAFDALPVAVQAAFYATRIAAEAAMDRNRFDIARALIEAQAVPPELAATKATILAHFH